MLRETTSRGLCGLVCPSRTSERGGEGYRVKGGWREEGERVRREVRKCDGCVCLLLQYLLQSCGLGWRIHESVEDTKLSTNKQHTLSVRVCGGETMEDMCYKRLRAEACVD